MFDKEATRVFLDKVPDLRSPWKAVLTALYAALLVLLCVLFFRTAGVLGRYAPLLSQLVMALLTASISYVHFRWVGWYRDRYGPLAYRYHFYHLMLPYLVAWYACFFHPLFISGPDLLPSWLSVLLGTAFVALTVLTSLQIERAGFHMETHGLDIYSIFPEEATVVRGQIYAYIRHPLYLALSCGTFGMALFANNWIALVAAVLHLIPALVAGRLEDGELIEREGETHQEYIQKTGALLPRSDWTGFFRLLLFLRPAGS
jgi:protein-S-isoprenylcysteine O-methyltransferase Ste14